MGEGEFTPTNNFVVTAAEKIDECIEMEIVKSSGCYLYARHKIPIPAQAINAGKAMIDASSLRTTRNVSQEKYPPTQTPHHLTLLIIPSLLGKSQHTGSLRQILVQILPLLLKLSVRPEEGLLGLAHRIPNGGAVA